MTCVNYYFGVSNHEGRATLHQKNHLKDHETISENHYTYNVHTLMVWCGVLAFEHTTQCHKINIYGLLM